MTFLKTFLVLDEIAKFNKIKYPPIAQEGILTKRGPIKYAKYLNAMHQ